jgi:hypothetical protein
MYRPAGGHSLSSDQMLDHWGQALAAAQLIIKRTLHIDGCENLCCDGMLRSKRARERKEDRLRLAPKVHCYFIGNETVNLAFKLAS